MAPEATPPVSRGAEYEYADGTIEVVFETAEGRVLTVREYPSMEDFERVVRRATYRGQNEHVMDLPDVDAFR